jgi:hypothetical protein
MVAAAIVPVTTEREKSYQQGVMNAPLDTNAPMVTLIQSFQECVKKHGHLAALKQKLSHDEEYTTVTWQEYYSTLASPLSQRV